MQWLDGILELWLSSFYWWGGFCAAFLVLSRFCPCYPGQNWWSAPRAAVTDFVYWLLLPLMSQLGRVALLVAGVNLIYSAMVHANLNWTFGPLRYVFASPVFHRWHHSTEQEGLNRNYAPTFPFLDCLWGTFSMPASRLPAVYGAGEPALPAGFVGQLLFPFRGTGKWALRRPILAAACVLAVLGLGYQGWCEVDRRAESQELAMQSADPAELPPELLRLSKDMPLIDASPVAANATGSCMISGQRDGSVFLRDLAMSAN